MSQALQKLQTRLQAASQEYQKLQADLSNAVDARQKLDAQLSENDLVKKVGAKRLFNISDRTSRNLPC
jgi:chaperonin cofactor prefoldin